MLEKKSPKNLFNSTLNSKYFKSVNHRLVSASYMKNKLNKNPTSLYNSVSEIKIIKQQRLKYLIFAYSWNV